MTRVHPSNPSLAARLLAVAVLAATASLFTVPTAHGQSAPLFRRDVIVLDAAHGGNEAGAALATDVEEKDVTLAFAIRLRSLLAVRGFTVVMTRSSDMALSADQRAEAANRARAVACLVIHATASGEGLHLATASLRVARRNTGGAVAWDRAQAAYLVESQRLANSLGGAAVRSHLPVVLDAAALRPLDNLSCPAVAIELAPSAASGSDAAGAEDEDYQQEVAKAVAGALVLWRNQADPPASVFVKPGVPAHPAAVRGLSTAPPTSPPAPMPPPAGVNP